MKAPIGWGIVGDLEAALTDHSEGAEQKRRWRERDIAIRDWIESLGRVPTIAEIVGQWHVRRTTAANWRDVAAHLAL